MRATRGNAATTAPWAVAAVLLAVILGGCTGTQSSGGGATPSADATASARPGGDWPGDLPDPASAIAVMPGQRGDCPIDPADPGLVEFVVSSGDADTPVRVTYPVFREDGQRMVRRMTSPGPLITVVLALCGDADASALTGFRAATDADLPLSCVLVRGGQVLGASAAEPGSADGPGSRVECPRPQ
ncbi:hypothetical protein ACDF64_13490 [Agromyces sp. MMS24-JH15]|uniref:hypothetical protein n=1 Tax=Agromyces sp. MMS24-JH15 TaxID=3243765 RepID=UPI003747F715